MFNDRAAVFFALHKYTKTLRLLRNSQEGQLGSRKTPEKDRARDWYIVQLCLAQRKTL